MSSESNNRAPKVGLWWRVLLGVSLALNLLVIGLVIGMLARFGGPDGVRPPPQALGAALYRELPRTERKAFREAMRDVSGERWDSRRNQAKALGAALRATPFDAASLGELLSDHATHRVKWQSALNAAWLDRVAAMSDNERIEYADRVEQALLHRHRGKRDKKKCGEGD